MKKINNTIGFTLIELIITVVVVGIIASVGATILRNALLGSISTQNITSISSQSRLVLQRMSRELRNMNTGSLVSCNDAGQTYATSITFSTTYDASNPITYSLVNGAVIRTVGGVAHTIANNVTELSFYCFGQDLQPTLSPASMYCIYVHSTLSQSGLIMPVFNLICPRNIS